MMNERKIMSTIHDIEQLFTEYGHLHYGEQCSQLIHAVSCAWHAQQDNASATLITAALLHDIGHFIADKQKFTGVDDFGHKEHASIGANWLKDRGFPASVYQPIRYHVQAKRYLVTLINQNEKTAHLSLASQHTLQQQGGKMSNDELKDFERLACFSTALTLRQYDDLGKPNLHVSLKSFTTLKPWLPLIIQVLKEEVGTSSTLEYNR